MCHRFLVNSLSWRCLIRWLPVWSGGAGSRKKLALRYGALTLPIKNKPGCSFHAVPKNNRGPQASGGRVTRCFFTAAPGMVSAGGAKNLQLADIRYNLNTPDCP